MTGIIQKFVFLKYSNTYPPVKIADGTQSPVLGNWVVQATPSLTLIDVLYVPKFPVSILTISQFTKHNNCKKISSHCMFEDLTTWRRIGSGHEKRGMYYLNGRVTPIGLVA